jgi:hypothetical protein
MSNSKGRAGAQLCIVTAGVGGGLVPLSAFTTFAQAQSATAPAALPVIGKQPSAARSLAVVHVFDR